MNKDMPQTLRNSTPSPTGMGETMTGIIKKLGARGFGFIETEDQELFFHAGELLDHGFDRLREGQHVAFELGDNGRGPVACNVRVISAAPPSPTNGQANREAKEPANDRHTPEMFMLPIPLKPVVLRVPLPQGVLVMAISFRPTEHETAVAAA